MVRRLSVPAVLVCLALASSAHAVDMVSRTLSESSDGTRLRVRLEIPPPLRREVTVSGMAFTDLHFKGMRQEGEPGAPGLPVTMRWVGVPPGGEATLRILSTQIDDLGVVPIAPQPEPQFEPGRDGLAMPRAVATYDPARYLAPPQHTEIARLGEPGQLRHQRVVPLEIRPLLYDPATRTARVVRAIEVEITVRAGPSTAGEMDVAAPRLATPKSWERIYGGTLLNARSAAAWRRGPVRAAQLGGPLKSGLLRPGLLGEESWKLHVTATGPARVRASDLLGAGFPDGTPVSQLRVHLLRYAAARPLDPDVIEIPIQIVDVDGDDAFESTDSFLFYGEHPRDDATSEDAFARYTKENIYWLSIATTGAPARMRVAPPRPGAPTGPTVFDQRLVYETDATLNRWLYGNNNEQVDSAELYFWWDRAAVTRDTIATPGRTASSGVRICVETQEDHGQRPYDLFVRATGRDSVFLASNPGTNPFGGRGNGAPPRQRTCGSADASQLAPGNLRFILQPPAQGQLVPLLDLVEVEYQAAYVARANRVRCTSGGATGETAFPVGNFTSPDLRAFDITDPKLPRAFDLTGAYAAGTLTLTDSLPTGATRTYIVVPDAGIPAIAVDLDQRDDILSELGTAPIGTYDVLVVANDRFAAEPSLLQWVAFRSSQGHRVRVVRTSDVYDAFRGGLQHYEAIHRLSRLAFTNWGISYLLLVGDGSEDAAGLYSDSGPNFVPSRVRYFQVTASSGGENEYRNDLNDKYYALVAGPVGDLNPDLLLGRFSVDSPAQLQAIVDKTILYENPAPGDDGRWRKRVMMFSDDEWVTRALPNGFRHLRECQWYDFEASIATACQTVDGAFPGDLHCVQFFLRRYSDLLGLPRGERPPIQPLHRPIPFDSLCGFPPTAGQSHAVENPETEFYRGMNEGHVGRALVDSVGEGVGFFAMQSHMNRIVVADEGVINSTQERPFHPAFQNNGKPFVVFGFGCHMNEFGVPREYAGGFPGDCLGEEFVNTPSRGAIATYASTGYEFLGSNAAYNERMWDVIFNKMYNQDVGGGIVDSDTLAADWRLSELTTITEVQWADAGILHRYVLFGDPLLQLDAGVPRISVDRVDNGFLQSDNRLVILDPERPLGLEITFRDEQGIDSLYVVKRFAGGVTMPIDSVTIVALADTAAQIRAKRAYRVSFSVLVDECNVDIVVGARDMAGRTTEFIGRILFDQELFANGISVQTGDRVDPRTAFRFLLRGCTPIQAPLPLEVYLDGALLPPEQVVITPDTAQVNWNADFTLPLANGPHTLRFLYAGSEIATYTVEVGGFGMSEVLAFPNPLRKTHEVMRVYFHLGEPISGGHLRVVDVNGRTVLKENLADPGVVKSDVAVPPGSIGSGVGQDDTHWNYVEIFRNGLDAEGDAIANGVYIYELYILGLSGQAQRKRDKLVIMR